MLKRLIFLITGLLLLAPTVPAQESGPTPGPCKPGINVYPADDAERPKFPRAYPGAPPVLTHGAGAFQVKLKNNECLDCHTPPESHFSNPFTGKKSDKVVRFNCSQCHVPQTLDKAP